MKDTMEKKLHQIHVAYWQLIGYVFVLGFIIGYLAGGIRMMGG